MSILVTGIGGHIGSNIARMLMEDNEEVVGFDIAPPGPHTVIAKMADKIPCVCGRIEDLAFVLNTVRAHKVESIVHTAAIIAQYANERPLESVRVNIEGTINVLEAARILNLKRVVCCTSSSVSGEPCMDAGPRSPAGEC